MSLTLEKVVIKKSCLDKLFKTSKNTKTKIKKIKGF